MATDPAKRGLGSAHFDVAFWRGHQRRRVHCKNSGQSQAVQAHEKLELVT
jgi:hypothetical protein